MVFNEDNKEQLITEKVDLVKQNIKAKYHQNEQNLINSAIEFAIEKHQNQLRKSGEPFIVHPLSVALTLIEWQMDYQTIIAGLLHDVIEDTNTKDKEIQDLFGKEILFLVKAVTKISIYSSNNRSKNQYGHNNQNYLIQMFLGMSRDIRVLFIKIADRLHNMQTIEHLKKESQERIALETQEIYANLAGRLGMYKIKNQLLDMCMKVLDFNTYQEVDNYINANINKNKYVFNQIIEKIKTALNNKNIIYECVDRIKSVYSTYIKLITVDDVTDLFALRIIVTDVIECYIVLGIVHSCFVHLKNSFKDFISSPKSNLYQSLHTVIFYKGLKVEIQIRTKQMDAIANYGIASHWKYKENTINPLNQEIKDIFYNVNEASLSNANIDLINERLNLIKKIAKQKYINVYNINNKKWINIDENTNAFEYAVLINKNKIAYIKEILVNSIPSSLLSTFDSGDFIEIIYDSKKLLNPSWKLFTKDESIRELIDKQLDDISLDIENDVNMFIKDINANCQTNYSKKSIEEFIRKNFKINDIKTFINNLKIIKFTKNDLYHLFSQKEDLKAKAIKKINDKSWKWVWNNSFFKSNDELVVKNIVITKCCSKLPFEDVVGSLTDDDVLEVHKYNCDQIDKSKKLIVLNWNKEKIKSVDRTFRARVILNGYFSGANFNNTSSNIISIMQKYRAVISYYDFDREKSDSTFNCQMVIFVKNYSNLSKIMNELITKSIINSWKLI